MEKMAASQVDPIKLKTIETFDLIAKHFDSTRRYPWPWTRKLMEGIKPGSRVLDMGCGSGRDIQFLISRGISAVGLDASRKLLELAHNKIVDVKRPANNMMVGSMNDPTADEQKACDTAPTTQGLMGLFQADLENPPFISESFDAVICFAAIHHLPTRPGRLTAIKSALECLRPGGALFLSVWAKEQEKIQKMIAESESRHGSEGAAKRFQGVELAGKNSQVILENGGYWVDWHHQDGSVHQRYVFFHDELDFRSQLADATSFSWTYEKFGNNHCAIINKD